MGNLEDLIQWATSNGCEISPSIQFKQELNNGIGAFWSSHDVKPQIQLPSNLIITSRQSINLFSQDVYDQVENKNSLLKLFLCHERIQTNSYFHHYFICLPSLSQIDSPYTWSAQDKGYLKGSNLGNSLSENLSSLIQEWWDVLNKIPDSIAKPTNHYVNMKFYYEFKFYTDDDYFKYFNEDDEENWTSFTNYLWASLILKSRSFPSYLIDSTYQQNECMLLPIVDLLNHNPQSKVDWKANEGKFTFISNDHCKIGDEIFNNYGLKGNEELLLAYGFAIEQNQNDSIALRIKLPMEKIDEIEHLRIKLPTIDDYTNSIHETTQGQGQDYSNGILFFINQHGIPQNLIDVFQILVRNQWEAGQSITLRMRLSGLNHLRAALESKKELINLNIPNDNVSRHRYIKWYVESQQKLYIQSIKQIKHLEKSLLQEYKSNLITLKNVYKKDIKFQQSLLFLGFPDYESILNSQFQDQCWLLWLIRCYNKSKDDEVLPTWIQTSFKYLRTHYDITTQDVLNYKPIYENLIPDLQVQIPEIYSKGDWTLSEFIIAAKLLDVIGFVRGKDQECILVEQNYNIS